VRSSRESGARLEKLIGNGGLAGARWSVRVSPLIYNSLVSPLFIGNVLGRTSLRFTSGKEPLAFWVPETLETGMTPIPPSNLTKRVVPLGREMNERDQRHCEQPCLSHDRARRM
jgi:hypothetical protein